MRKGPQLRSYPRETHPEEMEPGVYEVELNAQSLASGTYIYRIVAGDPSKGSGQGFVETKKMVLLH